MKRKILFTLLRRIEISLIELKENGPRWEKFYNDYMDLSKEVDFDNEYNNLISPSMITLDTQIKEAESKTNNTLNLYVLRELVKVTMFDDEDINNLFIYLLSELPSPIFLPNLNSPDNISEMKHMISDIQRIIIKEWE